ncbi:NADPH-dependent FMN reductase [Primorskyibacter sp. 2E107]|uniref:NADPH-dependent FMN reductase n=1 Tax=Primorskyibacter sp. 2E107 TaxID=3403458 RepID=UPI003AF8285D
MKILAIAATNSRNSINRTLVTHAAERLARGHEGAEIVHVDLNDYEMPIYSVDREGADGVPQPAQDLRARIGEADAVLIAFAEHNGTVTAAWKNVFDWMSRLEGTVWQERPVLMLSATPGPRAGANVLAGQELVAPFFGADLRGVQGFGNWGETWDAEAGALKSEEDRAALDALLDKLAPVAA